MPRFRRPAVAAAVTDPADCFLAASHLLDLPNPWRGRELARRTFEALLGATSRRAGRGEPIHSPTSRPSRNRRRHEERGVTVEVVVHDIDVIMDISDRVVVLGFGRRIAQGTPDEVCGGPAVIDAYPGACPGRLTRHRLVYDMRSLLPVRLDDLLHCRTVESARVEFKGGWHLGTTGFQVLKTLCAFANDFHNLNGGYVVLGVDEHEGRGVLPPRGVSPTEMAGAARWIRGHCKRIDPAYQPVLFPEVVGDQPRNVALVFFSDDPERWFPAARIETASFPEGPGGEVVPTASSRLSRIRRRTSSSIETPMWRASRRSQALSPGSMFRTVIALPMLSNLREAVRDKEKANAGTQCLPAAWRSPPPVGPRLACP